MLAAVRVVRGRGLGRPPTPSGMHLALLLRSEVFMKAYQVTASALAALLLVACGASDKHASAPERAQQAEEDKAKAQEQARDAREDADKARADAQDAARAQREADQNAQWAAQRAAMAEHDAHPAPTPTPVAGVTERQFDGAGPVASPNGVVSFATSRADLSAEGKATLDEIAKALRAHPSQTVIVEGYSDETGAESTDIQLSRQRADSVAHYLEGDGVSSDRVTTKGFGSRHPVSKDDTNRGRALNRRVEVLIQGK